MDQKLRMETGDYFTSHPKHQIHMLKIVGLATRIEKASAFDGGQIALQKGARGAFRIKGRHGDVIS